MSAADPLPTQTAAPATKRRLEARGLQKAYGSRKVVKDVSLAVEEGEVVGLLGPNGAGKTTSFYMIVGLVRADAGQISLDGQAVERLPIHRRARLGLGYLPQEASIFRKLNVEENIRAVLELQEEQDAHGRMAPLSRQRIEERLEEVSGYVDAGYKRIKLKIMPGHDVKLVAAVRAALPDAHLTVDANSAYTLADMDVMQALDGFGLDYIEQPLAWDDIHDHAVLQARMQTPMRAASRLVETARREPLGMSLTLETSSRPRLGPSISASRSVREAPEPSMPGGTRPDAMTAALRRPR